MNIFWKKLGQKIVVLIGLTFTNLSCSPNMGLSMSSTTFSQDIFNYLYENRQELNLCQGEIDQVIAQKQIRTYQLDQQSQLIEFLCFMGAYQGNYQYFLYQEMPRKTTIQPLSFEIFQEGEKSQITTKITVNSLGGLPTYQPQNQTLEIITKYRGLADCGSWGRYQWQQGQFILREYRLKATCDGQYIEPENYEIVYLDTK